MTSKNDDFSFPKDELESLHKKITEKKKESDDNKFDFKVDDDSNLDKSSKLQNNISKNVDLYQTNQKLDEIKSLLVDLIDVFKVASEEIKNDEYSQLKKKFDYVVEQNDTISAVLIKVANGLNNLNVSIGNSAFPVGTYKNNADLSSHKASIPSATNMMNQSFNNSNVNSNSQIPNAQEVYNSNSQDSQNNNVDTPIGVPPTVPNFNPGMVPNMAFNSQGQNYDNQMSIPQTTAQSFGNAPMPPPSANPSLADNSSNQKNQELDDKKKSGGLFGFGK
jgi:hypothetical protein